MSSEYTFYISDVVAVEPLEMESTSTTSVKIVNTGDETGKTLGFYLRVASNDGPFEYPSLDSPAVNLVDLLSQGNLSYGLSITQGLITTVFEPGVGDSYDNRIPLTIGTGTDLDEIIAGAFVTIELDVAFDSVLESKNFYVDFVIG